MKNTVKRSTDLPQLDSKEFNELLAIYGSKRNQTKLITSLEQFISIVDKIVKEWESKHEEFIYPWFRGHSSINHNLLPSIYRKEELFLYEDSYRQDFMYKSHPYLDQTYYKPSNDLEWYFLMQHYGMPTRLLDWTEGSLIALHFALNYSLGDDNPCVWILNPFELNKHFHKKDILFTDEKILDKYISRVFSDTVLPINPIALMPKINSKRIAAQKGCFLLFGKNKVDLSKFKSKTDFLKRIDIDRNSVEQIKDSLTITGITESLIFPELSGLAKEITQYWRTV